jgi:glutamate formiminotransferase/glutamate formiminotransferase/formiminotetrahydrofolate cyclodeaminase
VLECVINVSEGHDGSALDALRSAAARQLLDLHRDIHHNRAVLTLGGDGVDDAARRVARAAVDHLDLRTHSGVHPRIGVLDVVPFVPLGSSTIDDAIAARNAFASWAGETLSLPCFLYGPERSLPSVRRKAFRELSPDAGPQQPHPTAGACAVGARLPLVAFNIWLRDTALDEAQQLAVEVRSENVRALGLAVADHVQVSMNLVSPVDVGPAAVYDAVAATGARIARAELVGLVPAAVLEVTAPERWKQLDLDEERTIEASLARQAVDTTRRGRTSSTE